jgi:hypothetical protein
MKSQSKNGAGSDVKAVKKAEQSDVNNKSEANGLNG